MKPELTTYASVDRDSEFLKPLTLEEVQKAVEKALEAAPEHPLARLGPLPPEAYKKLQEFLERNPDIAAAYAALVAEDVPLDDYKVAYASSPSPVRDDPEFEWRPPPGYSLVSPIPSCLLFRLDWENQEEGDLWMAQRAFDRMCDRAEAEIRGARERS